MIINRTKNLFIIALVLTLTLSLVSPLHVQAENSTVSTEEELKAWCQSHKNSGGEVFLENDIIINTGFYVSCENSEIIINTGENSLVFKEETLTGYNFSIVGEGVTKPVLDVYDVYGWNTNSVNVVRELTVKAVGKDGIGGTAVRFFEEDPDPTNMQMISMEGSISSYGEGAIGIYLKAPQDLYCVNVKTSGKNSTAVYSEKDVDLYYSKLEATGSNAKAVSANVSLNTCKASPVQSGINSIDYHIVDVVGRNFYHPIEQNSGWVGYYDYAYTFLMANDVDNHTYYETLNINWSPDPNDVETQDIGSITSSGKFDPPFEGLGLDKKYKPELLVDIRDPDKPCISELFFNEKNDVPYATLSFWQSYDPSQGNVILWRSDDGGKTWYDFTYSQDVVWDDEFLHFYYGELESTVTLQIEVLGDEDEPGVGESNLAILRSSDGNVGGGIGGDRTGTDRNRSDGMVGMPNPNPNPNPGTKEEEPTSGAINKSGDGSSNHKTTNPPTKDSKSNKNNGNSKDNDKQTGNSILGSGNGLNLSFLNKRMAQSVVAESQPPNSSSADSDTAVTASSNANTTQGKHDKQSPLVFPIMILTLICLLIFSGLFVVNKFKLMGKKR